MRELKKEVIYQAQDNFYTINLEMLRSNILKELEIDKNLTTLFLDENNRYKLIEEMKKFNSQSPIIKKGGLYKVNYFEGNSNFTKVKYIELEDIESKELISLRYLPTNILKEIEIKEEN